MDNCILLNSDYTFLNIINWKKAICLITKGKVEVLKFSDRVIRNVEGFSIKVPLVMKLVKFIRILYKNRVPFSKKNIMVRDNFECMYCGRKDEKLTIDHVIPRSRGGETSFDNCVTSCRKCNNKKGSKTPREANMFLKKRPYCPTISEFLNMRVKKLGVDDILQEIFQGG